MRILYVLHQFYPEFCGGTERVALALGKAAQRAGHSVQVLTCLLGSPPVDAVPCLDLPGAFQGVQDGVPVTMLPRTLLPPTVESSFETYARLVEHLEHWMRSKRFDVAHILHPMRMASALLAVQRCQVPYLVTLTDFFFFCLQINLVTVDNQLCPGPRTGVNSNEHCLRLPWTAASLADRHTQGHDLLRGAGVRVCPSQYVADRFRGAFPDLDFTVIPHGVDMHLLPPAPANSGPGLTMGYIGTVIPQKGLLLLLRAMAMVRDPNLKLRVVGGFHGDPVYHAQILDLAKADPRVEILGELPPREIGAILSGLDLLCLPSQVPESFSLVLSEATAVGVPALVSDLGAPSERVTRHVGRVLPANDVRAWGNTFAELLANPAILVDWRSNLPLPLCIEEEAFFYEYYYGCLMRPN
jgi:glycosyltransferase involved in cell wall biosynthesis